MPPDRRLEFHDSKILAVRGDSECIRVELDGCIHQWEGSGASRRGTGWIQRVEIAIDFPDVDQGISSLPTALSDGSMISEALVGDGNGGVHLPLLVEGMTQLELVTTSGQKLRITGERVQADASGEARFVEEIPADMDPQRDMN